MDLEFFVEVQYDIFKILSPNNIYRSLPSNSSYVLTDMKIQKIRSAAFMLQSYGLQWHHSHPLVQAIPSNVLDTRFPSESEGTSSIISALSRIGLDATSVT